MRRQRFRFTVRGMMGAVAIIACVCGLTMRSRAFVLRARHYSTLRSDKAQDRACDLALMGEDDAWRFIESSRRWLEFVGAMERKYERAARSPWLPVAPDPPEPE
jgi:hypothetical protein